MIETKGLTKDFKDFRAVDSVTISVPEGSVFAVLGPNGAGKTTTVRMLTSILRPSAGEARVAGFDVVKQPAQVRASVGVLTEQHGLYERMKALEYLDFFGRVYKLPRQEVEQRANALLERFGLAEAANRRIGEYSKGMKQKLALVRAMLHNPPVLLLDEPTSAMDPQSAKQVRDALTELKQDKRTIVLTTHNLTEAEQLADCIAVIRRGRIIAQGTFAELSRRFVGDPVMEIQLARPLNGVAKELSSLVDIVESGDTWLRYRTAEPRTTNPGILRMLTGHGVDVVTLSEMRQSLEAVYLQIVEEDEKSRESARN
ncbi:MAG TPA: ABC transporter ATP-binding protein [Aggregatilineales bacterium]|nr:ABC transporter ATP-binding protein [Aggregatilineales bacterium]